MAHVKLILGPMYAAKTTALIRDLERYESVDVSVLAIKNGIDTRYGGDAYICTHNNIKYPAIVTGKLMDLLDGEGKGLVEGAEVIGIDEGQFYDDLQEFVEYVAFKMKKRIIVAALSGTFDQKMFPVISDIIPIASEIIHVTAMCQFCRKSDAPYTVADFVGEVKQPIVGGKEMFKASCANCLKLRR